MSVNKQKKFRLQTSQFFLTWPTCDVPLNDLRDFIITRLEAIGFRVVRYVIAHELHADGSPHRHAYVQIDGQCDISDARFFDIRGFHGNYQGCRSAKKVEGYCSKKDDYIANYDVEASTGARKLHRKQVCRRLVNGESTLAEECKEDETLLSGYRNLKKDLAEYKMDSFRKRVRNVQGYWYYGDTRLGKSWKLLDDMGVHLSKYPDGSEEQSKELEKCYFKNGRTKWFCGYNGEKVVLMDEVQPETSVWLLDYLKTWTDRLPCMVETKNGQVYAEWTQFGITSQHSIDDVFLTGIDPNSTKYDQRLKDIAAIKERFIEVHIKSKQY